MAGLQEAPTGWAYFGVAWVCTFCVYVRELYGAPSFVTRNIICCALGKISATCNLLNSCRMFIILLVGAP